MQEQIAIFINIVYHLKEWYKEAMNINDEEFNQENDFSILKLVKLQFFVTAINSSKNDLILNKFKFYAMPYGPVETHTYSRIKEDNDFSNFVINKFKTEFNLLNPLPEIESSLNIAIQSSILELKDKEPRLILADAGVLVDLSHKWNCWRKNYAIARANHTYSKLIPDAEIKNDIKILNLDLI